MNNGQMDVIKMPGGNCLLQTPQIPAQLPGEERQEKQEMTTEELLGKYLHLQELHGFVMANGRHVVMGVENNDLRNGLKKAIMADLRRDIFLTRNLIVRRLSKPEPGQELAVIICKRL